MGIKVKEQCNPRTYMFKGRNVDTEELRCIVDKMEEAGYTGQIYLADRQIGRFYCSGWRIGTLEYFITLLSNHKSRVTLEIEPYSEGWKPFELLETDFKQLVGITKTALLELEKKGSISTQPELTKVDEDNVSRLVKLIFEDY